MVVQCCVCKKIRTDGVWLASDPAAPRFEEVSHGYCPACADDAFREIREYHRYNYRAYTTAQAVHS